jgi:hypothetical protein
MTEIETKFLESVSRRTQLTSEIWWMRKRMTMKMSLSLEFTDRTLMRNSNGAITGDLVVMLERACRLLEVGVRIWKLSVVSWEI